MVPVHPRRLSWRRFAIGTLLVLVLLPPSIVVAGQAFLYWQYQLPGEDDLGLLRAFDFVCIASILFALITARTGWTRPKIVLCGLTALTLFIPALIWLFIPLVGGICLASVCALYILTRSLTHAQPVWRVPVAIALCPPLFALGTSLLPFNEYKWLWPWSSLRPQIIAYQTRADAAAARLGIPVGRKLTPQEMAAWEQAVPLRLKLDFPLIHEYIMVSVMNVGNDQRYEDGMVWMWWGYGTDPETKRWTFGPLNLRTMQILTADD